MTLKSRLVPAAKKPQIGHRDGLLQEPALVIQDEVFSRQNKVLRFEQLCRLERRAKALKGIPVMAAGVSDRLWFIEELINIAIDGRDAA